MKTKPAFYTVDFITALSKVQCRERLDRANDVRRYGFGASLAPVRQYTVVQDSGVFIIERTFPGALHPIRFQGSLDDDENSGGTWVHGAITHDTENQVLIEGLIVFLAFFLFTVLLYLPLRVRGFAISLPLMLLMLTVFSLRWRALRDSTRDLAASVRRRLYVTPDQVMQNNAHRGQRG